MSTDRNDTLSSSTLEPTMRKLPAVPVESRRVSRPLPKIPRALICKKCGTYISSYNVLLPLSSVSGYCIGWYSPYLVVLDPSRFSSLQRIFGQGLFVYRNVGSLCQCMINLSSDAHCRYNVTLAKPGVQLMATGAHTMQEITCGTCREYLGWKIIRAHEKSESWKDGNCLLELENLNHQPDPLIPDPTPRRRSTDSGSDYSS